MQIKSHQLSKLRQKLKQFPEIPERALSAFLGSAPMTRGTVYTLRRKCSKPNCRCARGELHSSLVLTINTGGKTRLHSIKADQAEQLLQSTAEYRRFRQARAQFIREWTRRKNGILAIVNAIREIRLQEPQK